jgi:RHH-type proline utilization regulon transcriptional repressor/proline dehydrogenase/delta 1-pyrroline-5-carboxylate dehydrogenase
MRAEDLDTAIALANAVPFGLTAGIHTLDDRESESWQERIEAGNLYVNRQITGAIVRRQPFGGWKASNVGPGAKAGGPNYVLQLGIWRQVDVPTRQADLTPAVTAMLRNCYRLVDNDRARELLHATARSYAWAWQEHYRQQHDPSRVYGEVNLWRYRPARDILARAEAGTEAIALAQALLAAVTCAAPLTVSLSPAHNAWHWLTELSAVRVVIEDEDCLTARLAARAATYDRLRALGPLSTSLRRVANTTGLSVIDQPVLANGRLELRFYLREQSLSMTVHRYGNVLQPYREPDNQAPSL